MTSRVLQYSDPAKLWFVGDLHGQYDLLRKAMQHAGFSAARGDQLVCAGDLVDCGPQSGAVLDLLECPWFHSVLGNHEKMLLTQTPRLTESRYKSVVQYLHQQQGMMELRLWREKQRTDEDMRRLFELCGESVARWIYNGADWFFSGSEAYEQQMQRVGRLKQAQLPYALECRLPHHTIGVVHAETIGSSWSSTFLQASEHEHITLWSREWFKKIWADRMKGHVHHPAYVIDGIDAVVFGHCITPTNKPEYAGNRAYLDVGAKIGRIPHLLRADRLLETLSKNSTTETQRPVC